MSRRPQPWREMSLAPRGFIAVVVLCGTSVLTYTVLHGSSHSPLKFFCYLVIALVASRLKVNLPGITGSMSVNFLFLLLGVLELSFAETMALGCAAVVVQCFDRDRPMPVLCGALAQDGGVAMNNLTDQIPDKEWAVIAKEFFLS